MERCDTAEQAFQSTLPARGATGESSISSQLSQFQSTLPARGATELVYFWNESHKKFQSTLPARGATDKNCKVLLC